MSFLDKVKQKNKNNGNANLFTSKGATAVKNNSIDAFTPKDTEIKKEGGRVGAPIMVTPGGMVPTMAVNPMKMGAPTLVPNIVPGNPIPIKNEEKVEEVKVDEPKETKVEEVKAEETKVEEIKKDTKKESTKVKKEDSKTTKKEETSNKKTKVKDNKKEETISKEEASIIDTMFKMPSTSVKYSEAINAIKSSFVDQEWEDFRKEIIKQSDEIIIESDMQEGGIKKTIAKLNELREKVWVNFIDTKALFESLSNKDTEGLIERVKYANLEGANDTSRKKSGVLSVMNYVTPEGEKINLYELYDETKNRFYFLRSVMDTIKYKSDILITMSSAIKLEKGHVNS